VGWRQRPGHPGTLEHEGSGGGANAGRTYSRGISNGAYAILPKEYVEMSGSFVPLALPHGGKMCEIKSLRQLIDRRYPAQGSELRHRADG
jgi:hypothetical protein